MKAVSRVIFFRSLACMLKSGIRIHKALELLSRTGDDPGMQQVAHELAQRVMSGESLSRAMMRVGPKTFSLFHIRLVDIGFCAGGLETTLDTLARYEESRRRDGMRVASALIYPAFVFALCLGLLLVGPATILSGQFELLKGMHVQVPALLVGLQRLSLFLCSWPGAFTVLALTVVACKLGRRYLTPVRLYRWAERAPLVGSLLQCLAMSRFARAMVVQLRAGLMPMQALEQAAQSSGHPRLVSGADQGVKALRNGADMRGCLARMGFFPRPFLEFIRAGEATGKLDSILEWLADIYQEEFESRLDTALAALQPLVLMGTGIVTASVLLVTMAPMVQALGNL